MTKRNWQVKEATNSHEFSVPGDTVEGMLSCITDIETQFGEAQVAHIINEDGEAVKVIISSGLKVLKELVDCYVMVVYKGYVKNPKSGRMYKSFEVKYDAA